LHSYVNNVNNVYSYAQLRLMYLGNTPGIVDVIPIYSSEPAFSGPWLAINPEVNVNPIYTNGFTSDAGSWKANINLIGYQWFAYSFMPYGLPLGIEEESDLAIYPNPTTEYLSIANPNSENMTVTITGIDGRIVYEGTSSNETITILVKDWPGGFYNALIRFKHYTILSKVMKV